MANTLANLARMYTETTGTGTLTLTTAVPGFNTFADAGVASGSTITYAIYCGPHREIGQGVYTLSGLTLTRGTVYSSTNGGAKISLTGRSEVFITPAAEDLASLGGAISDGDKGDITVSGSGATWTIDSNVISTFGRTLTDDADAATARTTLGLGTAATQNTGTSGATIPFLNGINTWSAANYFGYAASSGALVEISLDTDFGAPLAVVSSQTSANRGPNLLLLRKSPTPADNDDTGALLWQSYDSALAVQSYGIMSLRTTATTAGAISGRFRVQTYNAGSFALRFSIAAGVIIGAPTGDDTGTGTLNAVTLYENGTSLAAKYQPLDGDLTALAALSGTNTIYYRSGTSTWSAVTIGSNLTFSGGTLSATGGGSGLSRGAVMAEVQKYSMH